MRWYVTHKQCLGFGVAPFDYVAPTEKIRTSYVDLAFAIGDKVILFDGREMTVKVVEEQYNANLALMGVKQLERLTITLEGGGK